jgi:hypothetical protein
MIHSQTTIDEERSASHCTNDVYTNSAQKNTKPRYIYNWHIIWLLKGDVNPKAAETDVLICFNIQVATATQTKSNH